MRFGNDAHLSEGGFVRWNSNERIPFDDVLEKMHELGWITLEQSIKSSKQRDIETAQFLLNYREAMKDYVPSDEEMFEMRATFGEGVIIVDAISGQRIKL